MSPGSLSVAPSRKCLVEDISQGHKTEDRSQNCFGTEPVLTRSLWMSTAAAAREAGMGW